MPIYKTRVHCLKKGKGKHRISCLPQRVNVEFVERCKICGCTAHLLKIDGWYYVQCFKGKMHRGQMFRTSMEALTDWNEFNHQN